ncbi:MAG: DUF3570 domain-containing protein [Deltaproteobacteria bacterium]|nr:DUF3570 domain-containing protein [Deltaproteobacteria bacterium]
MTNSFIDEKKQRLSGYEALPKLVSAALAIPAVAATVPANAESPSEGPIIKFFYGDYDDRQQGASRMHVKAPMVWVKSPIKDGLEAEGSFVWDSMGGASPYYHNTLTGASGLGVEDIRRAGDLKVTKYFEDFSLGGVVVASDEDDYTSIGGAIESRIWTADKNTTFTVGFGGNEDEITSSIAPNLDESRTVFNAIFGITQVINSVSIIQSNITLSTGDGFYSDPYKTLDRRPESRDQLAWLTRYNLYIPELEGSLHSDYRFYTDSWEVNSHMLEFAWYQPIGERFMVRPGVRYYSQDSAEFWVNEFPPEDLESFITADQRLSSFGGVTGSFKVMADLWYGFSADFAYNYMEQRPEWQLGGGGSDIMLPFTAHWVTVGLSKQF